MILRFAGGSLPTLSLALSLTFGLALNGSAQAPSQPSPAAAAASAPQPEAAGAKTWTVPAGTRILLSLKHEISTRAAQPGDPVYFVSEFPVVEDGAVVFPAGMYVKGLIDRVQCPGRVKGRAQLQMHFSSMVFQNGVEIPLLGSLGSVGGSNGALLKNREGTVEQAGSKGRDARTVAGDAGMGAGVGGLASLGTGNAGEAVGIGAGAGAAVGIVTTLFTRGNDIVFPQGSTVEMVLVRPIAVSREQLTGMASLTGTSAAK